MWLGIHNPVHTIFFYELPLTKSHFTLNIVPNLKHSLSITLQHFFPFVGKLTIFPTSSTIPEIRYAEGDSVTVTFAECNLDFNDLIGNHIRDCDKFYHLIPILRPTTKGLGCIMIPVFSVQVTLFPNSGISIGLTYHHCLGDASTMHCFLKAWSSIAVSGSDKSFIANGTLPIYDRLIKYPKLDENGVKYANVHTFNEEYQLTRLSGPSDKVRATFILTRAMINGLKKLVSTQLPTLAYVSSFTVACAYIWRCVAKVYDEKATAFSFVIDCRSRLDPPVPAAYFGNCLMPCMSFPTTTILKQEKEGFLTAAKLIGENLYKTLTDTDGIAKDIVPVQNSFPDGLPMKWTGVAGTTTLQFYDLDFGFGKPRKIEVISIDYNDSISIYACGEHKEDLEIGVCLTVNEMDVFVRNFNSGLQSYIRVSHL